MDSAHGRYVSIALTAFIGLFSSNMIDESILNTNKSIIFVVGSIVGFLWGLVITNNYISSLFNKSHLMTQILLLLSAFSFCILFEKNGVPLTHLN